MKTHIVSSTSLLLALGLLAVASLAAGQEVELNRLGKVEFNVGCSRAVQQDFNRAMALYHSFAWREAATAFSNIAQKDPECGMAHWGRAMVALSNPFAWASLSKDRLNEAAAALDAARSAGLGSEREEAYVSAAVELVREPEVRDHRTRLQAFDEAMAELAAQHPEDTEASILSALATSANFDPQDKNYSNQLKAAAVLEPLFDAYPEHPGIAHYLIHSYDYPPLAERGLEAAMRYAKIAPDAPHALHMPSHIFTRVGYWEESIQTNQASAEAAGSSTSDALHAYDYMVYAHLQLAQDKAARQALRQSLAMPAADQFGSAYAYASMPARLALERNNWREAARLELQPAGDYPWSKYPQAEAINAFARGVGAAQSGDSETARLEHQRLLALLEVVKERKLSYWVEQIDIQAEVVRGLSLLSDGKTDEAVAILAAAADREDATEKHVVTPGPLLPAREVLADVLLQTGQGSAALAEFEAVLNREPNRYRTYLGAMKAAQFAGDDGKAQTYAAELTRLGKAADTERDELEEARMIVAD